ncbi:DUF6392 family protein [Vibrio maritimus]|uniref:DUF6392 family protein n=1 Tax=Vibrio maritimus TaxID=990268 RepID=UPI001F366424|nr:DUF6392 family protein [Vibrio maritimus]
MIEVGRMISMMGCTLEEIIDAGLLKPNQKPKPRHSGDDELILDMIREGVLLSFDRQSKALQRISLTLLDEDKPNYRFPNDLPSPLKPEMTKDYVHESMGEPFESKPSIEFMGKVWGEVEHYFMRRNVFGDLSQLVSYVQGQQMVKSLTYLYTKDVSWGELR